MLLSLLLAAATADRSIEPDLRCIAYLNGAINKAPAAQQPGLAAGIMYFTGRIDAKRPGLDYREALAPTGANARRLGGLERDGRRCLSTISERGRAVAAAGEKNGGDKAASDKADDAPAPRRRSRRHR